VVGVEPIDELGRLKAHDHVCRIDGSSDEWPARMLIPFLETGLRRGEKCLYTVEAHRASEVRQRLRKAGMDVTAYQAAGRRLCVIHLLGRDEMNP
jgi:KaiC/GvpD/RAD55 family RecA-like ATPase